MIESTPISSPHLHRQTSVGKVMRQVVLALLPGILLSAWVYGWGVIFQCLLAILFALLLEATMLKLRRQPMSVYLYDGSAVVTALLFALAISPFTPVWVNLAGVAFAICISKHAFGGLGYNLFNPAMAGYVFVLLCFPSPMLLWPDITGGNHPATLLQTVTMIFTGTMPEATLDSITGATPLVYMQTQLNNMVMMSEIRSSPLFGNFACKGTEWVNLAWAGGGIWLIFNRVIKWQMPSTFLGMLFVTSLLFYWFDTDIYISPLLTLFTGGTMLAAFFIITDPVTASTTPRGRIIYFSGIALLTYIIRTWGSYPDGIAFAVLLMNAAVPLIDLYTRPRIFGERS